MATFVLMRSPDGRIEPVRDGFSLAGFLLPPFWLLSKALWIEGALAWAFWAGLIVLCGHGHPGLAFCCAILLGLGVGLEGGVLHVAGLRRAGWREVGIVRAASKDEVVIATADVRQAATRVSAPARVAPALGLLRYPGKP